MSSRKDNAQSLADVLAAAVEAQCREYERTTGNPREAMWARLGDSDRAAVQVAQEHHGDRMRDAGRPGW